MIEIDSVSVWGFEHAIRGMRNPMNSWDKSDSDVAFHALQNFFDNDPMASKYVEWNDKYGLNIKIGENDLALMRRLYKAGTEHRKYLRQIFVSMNITAPLYWWKEFDTYKIGTTANSCSTMHKIHAKEFTLDDFSHEHLLHTGDEDNPIDFIIHWLNYYRTRYLKTKNKDYWWQIIQLLPTSYNQRRTITMNYENVVTIIKQRTGHKLDEWNEFVLTLRNLPYVDEIIKEDK